MSKGIGATSRLRLLCWCPVENQSYREGVALAHVFGGVWTEKKLEALRKYLTAYREIFTRNANAQFYKTIYIDAFAGTGSRQDRESERDTGQLRLLGEADDDHDSPLTSLHKGSARIALELTTPFDEYIFVDKSSKHTAELKAMISDSFHDLLPRCKVYNADAMQILHEILLFRDWAKYRAVLFVDPYGMNISWDIIERIAKTKAIDMWLLFPLGQGINRLLSRDHLPNDGHYRKLTSVLGTEEWKTRFYSTHAQSSLFEEDTIENTKVANFSNMIDFFKERLKSVFSGVTDDVLILENSRGSPLYFLCFAAGNPKGAPTATKIAGDLLRTKL